MANSALYFAHLFAVGLVVACVACGSSHDEVSDPQETHLIISVLWGELCDVYYGPFKETYPVGRERCVDAVWERFYHD